MFDANWWLLFLGRQRYSGKFVAQKCYVSQIYILIKIWLLLLLWICRLLHECAERGDFLGAEQVVDQMRHQRLTPGPKAYHALIYSYVRGRNSKGALKAIRKAVNLKKGKWSIPENCLLLKGRYSLKRFSHCDTVVRYFFHFLSFRFILWAMLTSIFIVN